MKYIQPILLSIVIIFLNACATQDVEQKASKDLVIAFGSCNDQNIKDHLWTEIANEKPDVFFWLGDAIYPTQYDLPHLEQAFNQQKNHPEYKKLQENTHIFGVYDDHDYGLNDGGMYNPIKKEAKALFVDFIDLKMDAKLQNRSGLYYKKTYPKYSTEVFVLDTRYNRSNLQASDNPNERYNRVQDGQILGEEQWKFLESNLKKSTSKNIILVSSIQVLNDFHGYEKWGNIISERERMINLLSSYTDKNIIILSGDRHYGEVSQLNGITEITSSGLNKVYTMADEPNPLRISNIIVKPNYGKIVISEQGNQIDYYLKGKERKSFYPSVQQ